MTAPGQCPRGHDLAENAVYCTVCWVRVVPEDPEQVAARRRRQRRVWFPLFGATAVLIGAALGGVLGSVGGGSVGVDAGPVAAPAPPTAPSADSPSSSGSSSSGSLSSDPTTAPPSSPVADAPVTVAIEPLAATVAQPISLTACVPDRTQSVIARLQSDEGWSTVESSAVIAGQDGCRDGAVEATVELSQDLAPGTRVRLVAKDDADRKVKKVTVTVQ